MWYWYNTALELDTLYKKEQQKVAIYSKITGVQNNSIDNLETVYSNKVSIDNAILTEKIEENKKLKRSNLGLKITTGTLLGINLGLTGALVYKIIKD